MRIATILMLLGLLAGTSAVGQEIEAPKHEFRSAWVATAAGLDWPVGGTAAAQEASLRQIIRSMKAQGMNAVVFQASPRGDAYYQSERLPWARRLSGQIGVDPGWDPLAVAIEEAHRLGMELHAWYNLGRLGDAGTLDIGTADQPEPQHLYYSNPEWTRFAVGSTTELWLQHADPDARQWALDNVMEIVENYEVDAVHFDFVRYPTSGFEDDVMVWIASPEFEDYTSVADWRRDNINKFMRDVYAAVKDVKPLVKVGSTPVGHYAASGGWPAGYGLTQFFSDSRRWLQEGVHDYLAPQLYWDIGNVCGPSFQWLARDWMGERYDRHIYIGTGPYQCGGLGELPAQIDTTRALGAQGHMHFRWGTVRNATYGGRYETTSIVPPMEWLDMTEPSSPLDAGYEWLTSDTTWVRLEWEAAPDGGDGSVEARRYAIYKVRADEEPDFAEISADNTHLIALTGETTFYDEPRDANTFYFVTALSMNNVESEPVVINLQGRATSSEAEIVRGFALDQNYPNPFNPSTTIEYSVERMSEVSLRVFNALGQEVAMLVDGTVPAGTHSVRFDADHLPSGSYFYVLDAGGRSITRAMMLIK